MGTRQLQKLQGNHLLPCDDASEADSSQSDGDDPAPVFNPFLLLDDDEDEGVTSQEHDFEPESVPVTAQQSSARRRTKKKSEKKKKQTSNGKERASVVDEVDIDAALEDLGMDATPPSTSAASAEAQQSNQPNVLIVNSRFLSPDAELKVIFGSSVLALEGRTRRAAAPPQRGQTQRGQQQRGQPQRSRPRLLSTPADFPPYDGSLSMRCLSASTTGCCSFQIESSSRYRTATMHLEQAQASMDPNQVAAVLAQYPFHVHSLLAMAGIYQTTGQGDYADGMLNRALYSLEGCWHPAFKACMLRGEARLPCADGLNGLMFVVLEHRVRALCRQGMHRTALEWAKLALGLDEDDPYGMLFHMDYLALRGREYSYIGSLVDLWQGPTVLRLVPSYAFSAALAAYYESKGPGEAHGTATGVHEASTRPGLDVMLINAITMFPTALVHLVKAMQGMDAAKSANWQSVMRRPVFENPHGAGSATLEHLSRIFATRHVELWKAPDVLAWMLRCAEASADAVDTATAAPCIHESQVSVADAHVLVDLTYPESTENEFSHLPVADYTDAVVALPPEQVMGGGVEAAGPELELMAEAIARNLIAQSGTRQLSDEELQAANPIMALLQTLMPWVSVAGEVAEDGGRGDEDFLAQVPGLTAFLAENGVNLTRQVPDADRPGILALIREYLLRNRNAGDH